MKRAFITGVTGQDGSYLAELLLGAGYEVHGLKRRSSGFNTARIDHLYRDQHEDPLPLVLHYGDLADAGALSALLHEIQPDEIYNLAAQSHVRVSFDIPAYTTDIAACGTLRLLEIVRGMLPKCRFYQSSSSEMFGSAPAPQNESTRFQPRSPYACAKVFGHHIAVNYRESYGLHVSSGILFNHESPRRGETFVTRKITRAVARIKHGLQANLYLGNLDARRDWGYAPDFVQAMWLMMQQDQADDYVIGTGEAHTVREFVARAFDRVGLDWEEYVRTDTRYFRPAEVDHLLADASKAHKRLGWQPTVTFSELVDLMVDQDLAEVESAIKGGTCSVRMEIGD